MAKSVSELLDPRELRLRARIDGLLAQRAARDRRILELERRLRVKEYRIIELLEERRSVA